MSSGDKALLTPFNSFLETNFCFATSIVNVKHSLFDSQILVCLQKATAFFFFFSQKPEKNMQSQFWCREQYYKSTILAQV